MDPRTSARPARHDDMTIIRWTIWGLVVALSVVSIIVGAISPLLPTLMNYRAALPFFCGFGLLLLIVLLIEMPDGEAKRSFRRGLRRRLGMAARR